MCRDERRIAFIAPRPGRFVTACAVVLAACTTPPAPVSVTRYEVQRGDMQVMYVANMSDVAVINEEPRTWVWKGSPVLNRFTGFRWEVERPDIAGIVQKVLPRQGSETANATVNFRFDSARLDRENQRKLNSLPVDVQTVRVDAYTDDVGGEHYNDRLSERRADAVANYLVVRGIPRHRISASGHGKTAPVASNRSARGRAQNRRADVTEDLQ